MITVTRDEYLADRQGRKFSDVVSRSKRSFDEALKFFNDEDRQRRMEESELHHNRPPLAGVVRELESVPAINRFLGGVHPRRSQRFRQAIGVLIRIIMEQRGWKKTGKKGSLGVRSSAESGRPRHNTGGLAFWFIRAERYVHTDRRAFTSVRKRCKKLLTQPRRAKSHKTSTATRGDSKQA